MELKTRDFSFGPIVLSRNEIAASDDVLSSQREKLAEMMRRQGYEPFAVRANSFEHKRVVTGKDALEVRELPQDPKALSHLGITRPEDYRRFVIRCTARRADSE